MCCNHFGAVAAEGAAGQSWGEQSKSKGGELSGVGMLQCWGSRGGDRGLRQIISNVGCVGLNGDTSVARKKRSMVKGAVGSEQSPSETLGANTALLKFFPEQLAVLISFPMLVHLVLCLFSS